MPIDDLNSANLPAPAPPANAEASEGPSAAESAQLEKLTAALLAAGLLTRRNLDEAKTSLAHQRRYDPDARWKTLTDVLVEETYVQAAELASFLKKLGIAGGVDIDVPVSVLKPLEVLVDGMDGENLLVSGVRPLHPVEEQRLLRAVRDQGYNQVRKIVFTPGSANHILATLTSETVDPQALYRHIDEFNASPFDMKDPEQLIFELLHTAVERRASDVHLVQSTTSLRKNELRFRVDGDLTPKIPFRSEAIGQLIASLKRMARLDPGEPVLPLDGSFKFRYRKRELGVRVSTIPYGEGETVVLRLLDSNVVKPLPGSFVHLQFVPDWLKALTLQKVGLMLLSGETGSGKTTTIAACLRESAEFGKSKVLTVEDPPELQVEGAIQVPVQDERGKGFPVVLRAFMRHDPDVIGVGEIRDAATAEIAMQAAQSGHAVWTTTHAKDPTGAVSRLIGLFSPSFQAVGREALADQLRLSMNQKLVRRLCSCAVDTPREAFSAEDQATLEHFGVPLNAALRKRLGCDACEGTGLMGRTVLPDALYVPLDEQVRKGVRAVLRDPSKDLDEVYKVPGVIHYTREDATRDLLTNGVLDPQLARTIWEQI